MLGERNYGLILSTQFDSQTVKELINQVGHFSYVPSGTYRIGVSPLETRDPAFWDTINAPAYESVVDIPSFFYLKKSLSFTELTRVCPVFSLGHELACDYTVQPKESGFFEGSLLLSLMGWRCISEQEWEAACFRQQARLGRVEERAFQAAARARSSLKGGTLSKHTEWTSSLGFHDDWQMWGTEMDELKPSSWFQWPGVILRGWNSPRVDVRSRFSSRRTGFDDYFRPVIEESLVQAMDHSPLKSYYLSRKKLWKAKPPGIYINRRGVISS